MTDFNGRPVLVTGAIVFVVSWFADPEVQVNSIKYARNFRDLTRERLKMNARLTPKNSAMGPSSITVPTAISLPRIFCSRIPCIFR